MLNIWLTTGDCVARDELWQCKPCDVVLDVGFGPGDWTLAALAQGACVWAFDPSPVAVALLVNRMAAQQFACPIIPLGLWDVSGAEPFSENKFEPDHPTSPKMPVATMDEFFAHYPLRRLDRINMDCEGAELRVVRGGRKTLARFRPDLIIEVHSGVERSELVHELQSIAPYRISDRHGFLYATYEDKAPA